jgi:hypothetical protein
MREWSGGACVLPLTARYSLTPGRWRQGV